MYTTQRDALSDVSFIVLAEPPLKPTDVPRSDASVTTDKVIKVSYAEPQPDNGGSPIISYELVIDDGMSGKFTSVNGFSQNSLLTTFTVSQNILKGRNHRLKYRAKNIVGWGPYSDESFVLAATVPARSERPYFLSFTDDKLSIVIPRCTDNGGTPITTYELWVDAGNNFSSEFSKLSQYANNELIFEAVAEVGVLESGRVYRFKTRTQNDIGYSEFSEHNYIAFGPVPNPPTTPLRVQSTESKIKVAWSEPAATVSDLPILGYVLNMDDGRHTDLLPIWISKNQPHVREYEVGGLDTGLPYRFSVQAVNINGVSQASSISTYYSCRGPSQLSTPYYIASSYSAKTIEIGWAAPKDKGGCPVLGYRIFVDDGNGGELTNEVAGFNTRNPNINSHVVTLAEGQVGAIYRFKVRSENINDDFVDTNSLSVALASLPSKPATAPVSDPNVTNMQQVGIVIDLLETDAEDGGSEIETYEI